MPIQFVAIILFSVSAVASMSAAAQGACPERVEPLQYAYLIGAVLLAQVAVAVLLIAYDLHVARITEHPGADLTHNGRLALAGELTASIAHEIAQPLAAILNNVETAELLLNRGPAPDSAAIAVILADIKRDDRRAHEIVNRLRALLRKRELQLEPVDINILVNATLALVRADAERRQVQLRTELEPDLPSVTADPIHLQQVVLNLLVNAMDAMRSTPAPARWLHLRTRLRAGSAIELAVRDHGGGIDPSQSNKLFESFFTTKEGGMGLGLSIARSIVHAHGGTISAENASGGGSTFVVRLPLPQRHRPPRPSAERLSAPRI